MDIIRFPESHGSTLNLQNASLVEGWDSVTWIERYRDSGEFTIKADASSHILAGLPIDSLISHTNTPEIMVVESHHIESQGDGEVDKVTITGRSFETFLEQRVVGVNNNWSTTTFPVPDYILDAERSWIQAEKLINDHIHAGSALVDPDNGITNVLAVMSNELRARPLTSFERARSIKRGDVYSRLMEILADDSLGLRSSRPCSASVINELEGVPENTLALEVHQGIDRSRSVAFSSAYGDIDSADYLRTSKKLKNAVLVSGRWVETVVFDDSITGIDRRWLHIDASDIDQQYSGVPTGSDLSFTLSLMRSRGRQALSSRNDVEISNVEIDTHFERYKYRADYQVGDLVGVAGEYNSSAVMRVIEHVEIEDDDGESGYPTLALP